MSNSPSRRPRGQGVAVAGPIAGTLVFEGGTIVLPDRLVEGSRIVCREGMIAAIGPRVALPRDALTIDARGRTPMIPPSTMNFPFAASKSCGLSLNRSFWMRVW